MSQQLQDLIDKIKKEGIQEAQGLSRGIEEQAHKKAEEIVAQAKKQAQKIIDEAQIERQKLLDVTHMALKQAARDTILNLHKEIDVTLRKIIVQDVNQSMAPEYLAGIISEAVSSYLKNVSTQQDIDIVVSAQDLKKLKDGFLTKLKEQFKQSITLKSKDNIRAGFMISFDKGKSSFDFTDESLVEYLSGSLNSEMAGILKAVVKS